MSDTVIRVDQLGKKYIIGHQQEPYRALRDVLARGAKSLGRRFLGKKRPNPYLEEFWALKEISFEVKRGDRVGIIGRNGAGKSTLLKILSRITEPTTGTIALSGRVASLLEVGTGFHPELTGRENIFLNGAILGMSKVEIKKKFDEIVAFAEVEKFLDTPVKRYSSGMYVRLAFAVAAHLEPEILVVDEVLAVGDIAFQKKCLGKMGEVAQAGRTVLFVSHNMAAVKNLCQTGIWLDSGRVKAQGSAEEVIRAYRTSASGLDPSTEFQVNRHNWRKSNRVRLHDLSLKAETEDGIPRTGKPMALELAIEALEPLLEPAFAIFFRSEDGSLVFRASTGLYRGYDPPKIVGLNTVRLEIDCLLLTSGFYELDLRVNRPQVEIILEIPNAARLYVDRGDFYQVGITLSQKDSLVVMDQKWYLN